VSAIKSLELVGDGDSGVQLSWIGYVAVVALLPLLAQLKLIVWSVSEDIVRS